MFALAEFKKVIQELVRRKDEMKMEKNLLEYIASIPPYLVVLILGQTKRSFEAALCICMSMIAFFGYESILSQYPQINHAIGGVWGHSLILIITISLIAKHRVSFYSSWGLCTGFATLTFALLLLRRNQIAKWEEYQSTKFLNRMRLGVSKENQKVYQRARAALW
jgi:hypothetical protein